MDALEAILYLERGPQPNLRFPLQQDLTTIGRGAGNDLVLVDPEVSRRHAQIVRQPHQFAVEDLGSTNGTFVNGQRVSSLTALQDADTIELGDTIRIRFVLTSPAPNVAEAPAPAFPQQVDVPAYVAPVEVTPPQPPVVDQRPAAAEVAYVSAPSANYGQPDFVLPPSAPSSQGRSTRGLWIGCGLFIALLLVCLGTFLLLDAFQEGRLLYCGPLRPVFEFLLGPLGFSPIC